MGFLYLEIFAIPFLREKSNVVAFIGDSFAYEEFARNGSLEEMFLVGSTFTSEGPINLFGIVAIGKAAMWVSAHHYEYIVFVINVLLLALTMRNAQAIFSFYQARNYHAFLWLFMLNPAVLASMVSLNKEIFGLFFISSFIRNLIHGSLGRYLLVLVISYFVREFYAFTGVLFFVMSKLRLSPIYYLVAISAIFPFTITREIMIPADAFQQRYSDLLAALSEIDGHPFGYLITYWPKVVAGLYPGLAPHRFSELSLDNLYGDAMTFSSIAFAVCSLMVGLNILAGQRIPKVVLSMFWSYTFLACLPQVSSHRFLFPLYTIMPMMVLLCGKRDSQERQTLSEAARGGSRSVTAGAKQRG